MAKATLVIIMAALLLVGTFLPSSGEDGTGGGSSGSPANSYSRGCNPSQQCRGGRRLLVEPNVDSAVEEPEEGAKGVKDKVVNLFY